MARRSVTATFAGGMNSDEFKPGTARYVENFVPNGVDGLVPCGPAIELSAVLTAMSGAAGNVSAFTTASTPLGWRCGGTYHPDNGFFGLMDVGTVTSTAGIEQQAAEMITSTAVSTVLVRRPPAYSWKPEVAQIKALSIGQRCNNATGAGNFLPVGTYAGVNPNLDPMTFVNVADETIMFDTLGAFRYAGGRWSTTQSSATGTTAWCRPTTTAGTYTTGTYTDIVEVYTTSTFVSTANYFSDVVEKSNSYIGIAMGHDTGEAYIASATSVTGDAMTNRVFRVKERVTAGSPFKIRIDGKIMSDSTAKYFKCTISPIGVIDVNQMVLTAATQPWGRLTESTTAGVGFISPPSLTAGVDPIRAACHHGGRLFVATGTTIRWSGTVDETLQVTCNSGAATATATTSIMGGTTANVGVEYSGVKLWSTGGYIHVFAGIGGDIVGLASVGDELLIMKRGGLFRMVGGVSYDGASDSVDLQVISRNIGPDSAISWAESQGNIIFTCQGEIWSYDGNELRNISRGTVGKAFSENITRDVEATSGPNTFRIKVTAGGGKVFFSRQVSRSVQTTAQLAGSAVNYRHLVLDMNAMSWQFVSNIHMGTPSYIVDSPSYSSAAYGKGAESSGEMFFLNAVRPQYHGTAASTSWQQNLSLVDIRNVFHRDGVASSDPLVFGTGTTFSLKQIACEASHLITHPLSGYGSMQVLRPRAVIVKRTLGTPLSTAVQNKTTASNATAIDNLPSLFLHDTESSFTPTTNQGIANEPAWWAACQASEDAWTTAAYTDGERAASLGDSGWKFRNGWVISTSSGAAHATIDRVILNNVESVMSAPVVHYKDDCWDRGPGSNRGYQTHIIHALELEFDDVENRTDR